jgi:hypothetical protein
VGDADELFERYLAAQRAKDLDGLRVLWHDDSVGIHPLRPDRGWRGNDTNQRLWATMWESNPDARFEVVSSSVTPERVFLEARMELPDGTIVPSVTIFEIEDGKFRECRVYTDLPKRDGVPIDQFIADPGRR